MIHLDTNVLIRMAAFDQSVMDFVEQQLAQGEDIVVSSIVWYEFLVGPTDQNEIAFVLSFLAKAPITFDEILAEQAAKLFNQTGQARTRKTDTMIAATALAFGGRIATGNVQDFQNFVPFGLKSIEI
ncbi:MAG: putative nucleic acid-binding protein [Verrucomicrobiales bacterium]